MAVDLAEPNLLTPAIVIKTETPFPETNIKTEESDNGSLGTTEEIPSKEYKVIIKACSELMDHTSPTSTFSSDHNMRLLTDGVGTPMVFTLGTNKHVYGLFHVDGGPQGWHRVDCTPTTASAGVSTFDIYEDASHVLHVAAASINPDGTSNILHTSFAKPSLRFDMETKAVVGLDTTFQWHQVNNNQGVKTITALKCGPGGVPLTRGAPFTIMAGSSTGSSAGAYYNIDPSPQNENPWAIEAAPKTTERVLEIHPTRIQSGDSRPRCGAALLYERPDGNGCSYRGYNDTGARSYDSTFPTDPLGEPRSVFASTNPWGYTDVVIAGDKGIAFYDYRHLTSEVSKHILPEISFKQVVCSETRVDAQHTKLSVFAISKHDELFYIQGSRTTKPYKLEFQHSGLPLRTGVAQVSTQFNAQRGCSEVLYIKNGRNEICHLSRDPGSSLWSDRVISIPSLDRFDTSPAYVMTLTLVDSEGRSVKKGYPVTFTSEPVSIFAQDRSYLLDARPRDILTDANGRITIVIPAINTLAAPTLRVSLRKFCDSAQEHEVYPAQRTMRLLGKIRTVEDLMNAKSTTGQAVFKSGVQSDRDFENAANVISKYPSMLRTVDRKAAYMILDEISPDSEEVAEETSFDKAMDRLSKFLGDVLEYLKTTYKRIYRPIVKMVNGILKFELKIGDQVLTAIVKTTEALVGVIDGVLRKCGTSVDELMDLLGLRTDELNIKKTQEVLIRFCSNARTHCETFMEVNRGTVTNGIGKAKEILKPYIKDTRPPVKGNITRKDLGLLGLILDNPVIDFLRKLNPMSWLMELAAEEMDDTIKIPNVGKSLSAIAEDVASLVEDELKNIWRLFEDFQTKVKAILANPNDALDHVWAFIQDAFWTLFDGVARIIVALWDIVTHALDGFFELVMGEWKLPFITSLYTLKTGQAFTFLNIGSYVAASLMYYYFKAVHGKLPFDVLGDPNEMFNNWNRQTLDMKPMLGLMDPGSEDLSQFEIPVGLAKGEVGMTDEQKKDLHNYHKSIEWCEVTSASARFALCTVEFFDVSGEFAEDVGNAIAEREVVRDHNPLIKGPIKTVSLIYNGFTIVARIVAASIHVSFWAQGRIRNEISSLARGLALVIPPIINGFGLAAMIKAKDKHGALASNSIHCLATFVENLIMLFAEGSHQEVATAELIASVCGILNQACQFSEQAEFAALAGIADFGYSGCGLMSLKSIHG